MTGSAPTPTERPEVQGAAPQSARSSSHTLRQDGDPEPGAGPGFLVAFGVTAALVVALRLAMPHVPPMYHTAVLLGVLVVALLVGWLRTALWKSAVVVLLLSAAAVVWRQGAPRFDGPGLAKFGRATLAMSTGWGIGKDIAKLTGWKQRQRERIIQEARSALAKGQTTARGEFYRPYMVAVNERSDAVRAKAAELTRPCKSADQLCEVATLNRFVANRILYRNDPRADRSGEDLIQSPERTLAIGAGDCDDQTILLASLLESVGRRTVMAFTSRHVFPVVCFDETLPQFIQKTRAYIAADAEYGKVVTGAGGWPAPGQEYMTLRVGAETCFPLEPTMENAMIGQPFDPAEVQAVVDPLRGQYVQFDSGGRARMP